MTYQRTACDDPEWRDAEGFCRFGSLGDPGCPANRQDPHTPGPRCRNPTRARLIALAKAQGKAP